MGTIKTGIVRRTIFGGGTKLYASGVHYSNISDNELINFMKQNSQVGYTAAVAAVEAFKAVFTTFLLNGHTMQVPYLGTFSLTCNSKGTTLTPPAKRETAAEKEQWRKFISALSESIYNYRVRFTPTQSVRTSAKSVKFQPVIIDPDL